MRVSRQTLAVLACLPCLLLSSCQGESGSSKNSMSLDGFWASTSTPTAGSPERRINITFSVFGDPEDGNYTASVRFPQTIGARRGCPAREFQLVGTLDGERLEGKLLGIKLFENRDFAVDFTDNDTGIGTYEVTKSGAPNGDTCTGETGTLILNRFIAEDE